MPYPLDHGRTPGATWTSVEASPWQVPHRFFTVVAAALQAAAWAAIPLRQSVTQLIVRSIGISIYPAAGSDARTSLKRADEGMYLAKSQRAWGAVFAA